MPKPAVIVSDIHLGGAPAATERAFLDFLADWPGHAETLLINGDLFDFWFEWRTVILADHFPVLKALADLRDSGVRLMLVGGNHDGWGGRFLEEDIGVELIDGPAVVDLGGRRALVAHGDGLGPGDLGYKLLRAIIRSWPARLGMRLTHPDLADRIVQLFSRTGDRSASQLARSQERAKILEDYALSQLEARDEIDLVVLGHCHIPLVRPIEGGGFYVNSGDWIEHRTYTLVDGEEVRQCEWEG